VLSPSNAVPHSIPSLSVTNRVTLIQNPLSSSKDPGYYAWLNHTSALIFFFKVPNALHCHVVAVILSDLQITNNNRERHYNNHNIYWVSELIPALLHPEDERTRTFQTSLTTHHSTRPNKPQDLNLQLLVTSVSWRHRIKRSCYPNWQLSHTSQYHMRSKR
jgi:hypothetical protein